MKRKLITSCAIATALAVGFFAGRFVAGRQWEKSFEWYVNTEASNQAHFYVRALSQLREGQRSNALEFLEGRLDGALLTYCTFDRLRPENRSEAGLRAIHVARDYRAKHPWRNSSDELNTVVQRLFVLDK
jgi:hypothetical protein